MKVSRTSRRQLQLQNLIFIITLLIVVGLLAWLSNRYSIETDWTRGSRNTLSIDSRQLLDEMPDAIHITAFATESSMARAHILDLVSRYQRYKPHIELTFINPDAEPERTRDLGITLDGELLIAYQGRSEKLQSLSEQSLTNTLLRIARQKQRKVAYLSGHGERDLLGEANHDFGQFGKLLEQKGIELAQLNLAETGSIPDDINLLVIADPRVPLLSGEVNLLNNYVKQGGNLLWLSEPASDAGLAPLAETLGAEFLPGVIVDATTQLFGIDNPAFAIIPSYPMHPITRTMNSLTLFPQSTAIEVDAPDEWQATPLLTTLDRAWTEIGAISGTIRFDEDSDERMGPLDIGFVFTRPRQNKSGIDETDSGEQRVIVIGDSDFLSNTYLGNGANVELGLNLFNWLNHDDQFISITARTASDVNLELSKMAQIIIGFGFLFVLPLLLLGSGIGIWWRRRNR
ncbi:Gliding motility-associated ABC transporter substrate-binding protein GldG [hydrothermal vent metagenome]|uniref:Gliding motility-associated ABC transporter substrate-binding protein GldG n=1 Tax=hydrothermal vent metagenome TaxID=652676 RepID=A0A3B0YMG2_9ZZZZ